LRLSVDIFPPCFNYPKIIELIAKKIFPLKREKALQLVHHVWIDPALDFLPAPAGADQTGLA
jgi:hypothetical protein